MNRDLFFSRDKPVDILGIGRCDGKGLSDEFIRNSDKRDFGWFPFCFEA